MGNEETAAEKLIETEVKGIYRDPSSNALIIKKDSNYRDLMRRLKQLEGKVFELEEKLRIILNKE